MNSHTLGTLLRTLIDRLDGDVEARYIADGLDYRPRFTPVVRALDELGPASIMAIASHVGMRHSAISQTISQMQRRDYVTLSRGVDGRERIVTATHKLVEMLPLLKRHWDATAAAVESLDNDLSTPLTSSIRAALTALDETGFAERAATRFNLEN
jgi:DNA-binding MarR family transcriptional regulator